MPINLSPYLPQEPDQGVVPAAFNTLIHTIIKKKEQAQQQQQFEAEQAQLQSHFDTTEKRLTAADASDAQYKQSVLAQNDQHHKDEASAARREKQVAAAHAIGEALSSGRQDVVETMAPYLHALGMEAKVQDSDPVMQAPAAFSGGIPQMDFALGPRKLVIHADGQPMGDIDLDHLQSLHQQSVEPLLQTLIGGASEQDQGAYGAAADAIRSNPQLSAQGGPDVLKTVNEMAGKRIGIEHTDAREQMRVDAATQNAATARAMQERRAQLQQSKEELARQKTVNNWARQVESDVATRSNVKSLAQVEQDSTATLNLLDLARKDPNAFARGSAAAIGVGRLVKSLYGKAASDREGARIIEQSYGIKLEQLFNRLDAGEMPPEQIGGLYAAIVANRATVRQQINAAAAQARQGVLDHPYINQLAPDMVQDLGNQAASHINGMRTPPKSAPQSSRLPGMPGSAIQNQADELRGQDDEFDSEYNRLLGGGNANP